MMAWPFGIFSRARTKNKGAATRNTWASWVKGLSRNKKAANDSQPGKPAKRPELQQRPRFTESLENRKMLTASAVSFAPVQFYPLITGSVQVGNFINGGLPDLVGVDGTDNVVHVLLNKGDGTFRAGQSFYVPQARAAAVADFNGDGNEDIAVASPTNSTDTSDSNNDNAQSTIYIFYGNGEGTFQTPPKQVPINFQVTDVVAADLNGDGFPDLIATIGRRVIVLINRGNGTFFPPKAYPAGAELSGQLVVGDFNGDGVPDIAVTRFQSNEIAILLGQKNVEGQPTGTFGTRELYHVGSNPRAIAVGDFNGDGKEDLAVVNAAFRQPSLWVYMGNGDGTFSKPEYYYGGNFVDGVATGDFTGNGITDVATVSFTSFLRVYAGNGDGTFQPFKEFPDSAFGQNVVTADFNGDGLDDIATATGGGVRVLLSTTQATPPPATTSLDITLGGGNPRSISYRDASGTTAKITLGGPGAATVDFSGDNLSLNNAGTQLVGGSATIASIVAAGTTSGTTLSINATGINGIPTIGPISTDGSFKAIIAPRINLVGNLSIPGTLGSLDFDNMSSGTITLGTAGAAANLTLRNATDETLDSAQPIGRLAVGQWVSSTSTPTTITAPAINSINARSQFAVNLSITAGGIKSVTAHNLPAGTWTVAGAIGPIISGRDVDLNVTATSIKSIAALEQLNNLTVETTGNIGPIRAKLMANSSLYAGVGPLLAGQRLPESAGDLASDSSIASISLQSRYKAVSFSNSSIAAAHVGPLSLGVIAFSNFSLTQGIAADSVASFSGADVITKKTFALNHPTSLAPLTQDGIATADFAFLII
ncbi:MAG TPA: VCBS repeat-containing protein [Tepidisphaeraceae bacterium]|jgi:hypothetical protein|nr:VCBS repeat-containing protein [Tepidisphaeraceae bacterium]